VQLACRHDVIAHRVDQWRKQLAGCADPSGQGGAVQVDAFASVDLRLPVERLPVASFRLFGILAIGRAHRSAIGGIPWFSRYRRIRRCGLDRFLWQARGS
jgi:hypothetical protein